jgi:hypothetical protein
VTKRTENPVTRRAEENTAAQVWDVDLSDALPFGCEAVAAISVLADGVDRDRRLGPGLRHAARGARAGAAGQTVELTGPNPCAGRST